MPEKCTLTSKTSSVCKIFYTALCLKHGTPHLVTSNEKLESLKVGGFPVHCGLPCGATLCHSILRPRSTFQRGFLVAQFLGRGGVNKISPRQDRETTWKQGPTWHVQQSGPPLPKIYVSEGVSVNETPEMTTFWGGVPSFFGGGAQKGPAQRLPRFHVLEPQNVVLAAVWRHVSGFTFRTPRFGT